MKKILSVVLAIILLAGLMFLFYTWRNQTNLRVVEIFKWLTIVSIFAASWAFAIPISFSEKKVKQWWKPTELIYLSISVIVIGFVIGCSILSIGKIAHASTAMIATSKISWGIPLITISLTGLMILITAIRNGPKYRLFELACGTFLFVIGVRITLHMLCPTFSAVIIYNSLEFVIGTAFLSALTLALTGK